MLSTLISQVQQSVSGLHGWITATLNGNDLIAGAVTASVVGSLVFFARKLPLRLWYRIKRYVIFTYVIEYQLNEDHRTMIREIAEKFEHEIQKRVGQKRSSARLITRKNRLSETLTDGGFFMRYGGAWFYVSRHMTNRNKEGVMPQVSVTLSLTALRAHRPKILALLRESAREYTVPGIYQVIESGWSRNLPNCNRMNNFTWMAPLAIDQQIRETIDEAVDNFVANRARNNLEDKPHKLVFLFHGEPGTGKSALAEYIAFRLKMSLFVVNSISFSDRNGSSVGLQEIVAAARENITEDDIPVILCDDYDTYWKGARKRKKLTPEQKESRARLGHDEEETSTSLGRLLSALQSPVEIRDCIMVFTTNHLEMIDPAMYRPGRVTVLLEIGRMSPKSVMEYYEKSYGLTWPDHTPIERAWRACDVSAFFAQYPKNPQAFVEAVTSVEVAADEAFREKADAANV